MKYNKKQKEIIAYCLSLLENECENENTRNDMITIIQDLQSQRIFGNINFYKD